MDGTSILAELFAATAEGSSAGLSSRPGADRASTVSGRPSSGARSIRPHVKVHAYRGAHGPLIPCRRTASGGQEEDCGVPTAGCSVAINESPRPAQR